MRPPPAPQAKLPPLTHQKFGLGGDDDKRISLWCFVDKITEDGVQFRVINGNWHGLLRPDGTFICYSPHGHTVHKVTARFLDPMPDFASQYYHQAIDWMNNELADPEPYLIRPSKVDFSDMDDDIPF